MVPPERKMWRPVTGMHTVAGVSGAQNGTTAAQDNGGLSPDRNGDSVPQSERKILNDRDAAPNIIG